MCIIATEPTKLYAENGSILSQGKRSSKEKPHFNERYMLKECRIPGPVENPETEILTRLL